MKPTNALLGLGQIRDILISGFKKSHKIDPELPELENIGLMISCYDSPMVKDFSTHAVKHIDDLKHVWAPIDEVKDWHLYPSIYKALLGLPVKKKFNYKKGVTPFPKLFKLIDECLDKKQDVFIHCTQGEHRSAALAILYLHSRTQSNFVDAWNYVRQVRRVEPHERTTNRDNLMTIFKSCSNNIEGCKSSNFIEKNQSET